MTTIFCDEWKSSFATKYILSLGNIKSCSDEGSFIGPSICKGANLRTPETICIHWWHSDLLQHVQHIWQTAWIMVKPEDSEPHQSVLDKHGTECVRHSVRDHTPNGATGIPLFCEFLSERICFLLQGKVNSLKWNKTASPAFSELTHCFTSALAPLHQYPVLTFVRDNEKRNQSNAFSVPWRPFKSSHQH